VLRPFLVFALLGFSLAACASGTSSLDPGSDDAGGSDGAAGSLDGTVDAGPRVPSGGDGGQGGADSAGSSLDAAEDATGEDASSEDADLADAASNDAGAEDSATAAPDAEPTDSSAPVDAADAAVIDAATADGSVGDARPADAASCGPPAGGYTATCSGCTTVANTLTCECQNAQQQNTPASLDLCICPQPIDVENFNGAFNCCGSPSGSYTGSCSSCSTTGSVLSCSCKNDSQQPTAATLNLCTCSNTTVISNQNGVLACP
jgi:CVNH domain